MVADEKNDKRKLIGLKLKADVGRPNKNVNF